MNIQIKTTARDAQSIADVIHESATHWGTPAAQQHIKPHITRESGRWVVYLAGHQYASFRRFSKLVDCFEDRAPKYFDTLLDGLRERDVIGLFDRPILKDRLGAPRSIPSVQFSPEVTALIASQNLRLAEANDKLLEIIGPQTVPPMREVSRSSALSVRLRAFLMQFFHQ